MQKDTVKLKSWEKPVNSPNKLIRRPDPTLFQLQMIQLFTRAAFSLYPVGISFSENPHCTKKFVFFPLGIQII